MSIRSSCACVVVGAFHKNALNTRESWSGTDIALQWGIVGWRQRIPRDAEQDSVSKSLTTGSGQVQFQHFTEECPSPVAHGRFVFGHAAGDDTPSCAEPSLRRGQLWLSRRRDPAKACRDTLR